jgi:hypothetical protein
MCHFIEVEVIEIFRTYSFSFCFLFVENKKNTNFALAIYRIFENTFSILHCSLNLRK